jgi:hypothetical protein
MPRNCADCKNATKKQHEIPCKGCYDASTPENHFPEWEPKQ